MSTNDIQNNQKPAEESERAWYAPVAELFDVGNAIDFWKEKAVKGVEKADSYVQVVADPVSKAYHYLSETGATQIFSDVVDASQRIAQHFPKAVEVASTLVEQKVYPAVVALTDGVEKVVSAPLHHGVGIVKAKVGGFLTEHEQTINPVADFLGAESVLASVKEYFAVSEDAESLEEAVHSVDVPSPKLVPPSCDDDDQGAPVAMETRTADAIKPSATKTKQAKTPPSKKENTKTLPNDIEEECEICEHEAHEKALSRERDAENELVSYSTPVDEEITITLPTMLVETEEGEPVQVSSAPLTSGIDSSETVVQNTENHSGVIAKQIEENQNQSLGVQTTSHIPEFSDGEDESFSTIPSHDFDESQELFIPVGHRLITGGNGRSVEEVRERVPSSSRLPGGATSSQAGESQRGDVNRENNPLLPHRDDSANDGHPVLTLSNKSKEPLNNLWVSSGKNPLPRAPHEVISGKQDPLLNPSDRAHAREVQSGIVDARNAALSAPVPAIANNGTLISTDTDVRTMATRLSHPLNDVPGSGDKGADSNDRGRDRSTEAIYAKEVGLDKSSDEDVLLTEDIPYTYPSVFTDLFT